jgi:hypothetical protein
MPDSRINRPGAPTNPPHTAREGTGISDYHPALAPSGAVPPVTDSDPHPSDEGHPYGGDQTPRGTRDRQGASDSARRSPSATPRYLDIRPNPAIHTGHPEPKPDNADRGPRYSPG